MERKRRSRLIEFMEACPGTAAGLGIIVLLLFCGIFADLLYGMNEIHLQDPSWKYPLGADQLGRDSSAESSMGHAF